MRRLRFGIVLVAVGSLGCSEGRETAARRLPLAPTGIAPAPAPNPAPPSILVFTDPVSRLTTSDVHDAQEQVFQFNSIGQVIWTADGNIYRFAAGAGEGLIVRFATKRGERRAYLVYDLGWYHYEPPEIVVDLEVVDGNLIVSNAKPAVPLPGS